MFGKDLCFRIRRFIHESGGEFFFSGNDDAVFGFDSERCLALGYGSKCILDLREFTFGGESGQ